MLPQQSCYKTEYPGGFYGEAHGQTCATDSQVATSKAYDFCPGEEGRACVPWAKVMNHLKCREAQGTAGGADGADLSNKEKLDCVCKHILGGEARHYTDRKKGDKSANEFHWLEENYPRSFCDLTNSTTHSHLGDR